MNMENRSEVSYEWAALYAEFAQKSSEIYEAYSDLADPHHVRTLQNVFSLALSNYLKQIWRDEE